VTTLELNMYDFLQHQWGAEEAKKFLDFVEKKVEEKQQQHKELVCTKADLAQANLDTKTELAQAKLDLIKWMIGLWMAQTLVMVGLYLKH
jgi:hypothetical protein